MLRLLCWPEEPEPRPRLPRPVRGGGAVPVLGAGDPLYDHAGTGGRRHGRLVRLRGGEKYEGKLYIVSTRSTYLYLTVIPNTTETYCHRHGNGCHEEADLTMPPHLGGKNVTDVSICCCDQDL